MRPEVIEEHTLLCVEESFQAANHLLGIKLGGQTRALGPLRSAASFLRLVAHPG